MILFIMAMFGIMGVMAIAVDMGLVVMTRTQMQSAVDTAAIEGLRMRDFRREQGYGERDFNRRVSASRMASLVFDADGELTGALGAATDDGLGAGPIFEMSGGVGEAKAGQLFENATVYKPSLQLNVQNERHGDLVQGTYVGDAEPFLKAKEGKRYIRSDFEPARSIPGSPTEPTTDAFLARMRRTNDFLGLDNIRGVSSAGPPISMLFGTGGTLPAGDVSRDRQTHSAGRTRARDAYNYRQHGYTVRATAISQSRPVLSVGVPVQVDTFMGDKTLLGRAPFVLKGKYVKQLGGGGKVWVGNSKIKTDRNGRKIGWFVPHGLEVGAKVRERDLAPIQAGDFDAIGYVPIIEKFMGEPGFPVTESDTDYRVIGFGLFKLTGDLEVVESGQVGGKRLKIRQFTGPIIMPENTSAVAPPTFYDPTMSRGTLGAKAVELLLRRNEKLARAGLAIWAPALVQ